MRSLLFVFFAFLCGSSHAASFDCRVAGTPVEKLVCSDAQLSKMDEDLAHAYNRIVANLNADNKREFIQAQRSWLKNSRSLCDDVACLRRAYETRIQILAACDAACGDLVESYTFDGEKHNLITMQDPNERNRSFNQDLLKQNFNTVAGCESLVEIAVGTAHGNQSYGGVCKLKNEKGIFMICNDEMLGHFRVARIVGSASRRELADFTFRNCFGG